MILRCPADHIGQFLFTSSEILFAVLFFIWHILDCNLAITQKTKMQSINQLSRTELWYLPTGLSCLSVQYWASLHPCQPFSSLIRSDNCSETIIGELGRIISVQCTLQEDWGALLLCHGLPEKILRRPTSLTQHIQLKLQIYTNIVNLFEFIWKW